MMLLIR